MYLPALGEVFQVDQVIAADHVGDLGQRRGNGPPRVELQQPCEDVGGLPVHVLGDKPRDIAYLKPCFGQSLLDHPMSVSEKAPGRLVIACLGQGAIGNAVGGKESKRGGRQGNDAGSGAIRNQIVRLLVESAFREAVRRQTEDPLRLRLAAKKRLRQPERSQEPGTGLLAQADDNGPIETEVALKMARREVHEVFHVAAFQIRICPADIGVGRNARRIDDGAHIPKLTLNGLDGLPCKVIRSLTGAADMMDAETGFPQYVRLGKEVSSRSRFFHRSCDLAKGVANVIDKDLPVHELRPHLGKKRPVRIM